MTVRHGEHQRGQEGFTLIELLVVVLIIAILAAIAIPAYLKQREEAWTSQVTSAVKNMAIAEESYLIDNSSYTDSLADLTDEGFKYSTVDVDINADVNAAGANGSGDFCVEARSTHDPTIAFRYRYSEGRPEPGLC